MSRNSYHAEDKKTEGVEMDNTSLEIPSVIINNTLNLNASNATLISSLSSVSRATFHISYFLFNHKYGVYVSHLTIVLIALTIIIAASYASLSRPKSAPKLGKSHPDYCSLTFSGSVPATDFENGEASIGTSYALFIPVLATIGLTSLYYGMKYINKDTITWFFAKYTLVLGFASFTGFAQSAITTLIIYTQKAFPEWNIQSYLQRVRITVSDSEDKNDGLNGTELYSNVFYKDDEGKTPFFEHVQSEDQPPSTIPSNAQVYNIYISLVSLVSLAFGFLLSLISHITSDSPNYFFQNFTAWCFAFGGIKTLNFNSFIVGFIILSGLFFYDIYFVFKTDIMITVATSITIPMLLRLPSGQDFEKYLIDTQEPDYIVPKLPFSMLGLGDIVVPGAFIALCLRYDQYKFYLNNPGKPYNIVDKFQEGYFKTSLISYITGLVFTFIALHYSNSPQPALLYLSPSLIFGTLGYAYYNGELAQLFAYTGTDDEEAKEAKEFAKLGKEEKLHAITSRMADEYKATSKALLERKISPDDEEKLLQLRQKIWEFDVRSLNEATGNTILNADFEKIFEEEENDEDYVVHDFEEETETSSEEDEEVDDMSLLDDI